MHLLSDGVCDTCRASTKDTCLAAAAAAGLHFQPLRMCHRASAQEKDVLGVPRYPAGRLHLRASLRRPHDLRPRGKITFALPLVKNVRCRAAQTSSTLGPLYRPPLQQLLEEVDELFSAQMAIQTRDVMQR